MKRTSVFLLLLSIIQISTAQSAFSQSSSADQRFVYPNINKYGNTLDDFSSKNWEITDTVSGDLNKDGIDDFALVLSYQDSIKIEDGYKFPRMLLLVLKVGDHYELKLQHNTLIEYEISNTAGWNGDPFENMEIINGVLKLHFKWDITGVGTLIQYIVRYQSNDFYLIGATRESGYHSDTQIYDFNFSTKRYTYDETDIESGFGGEDHEYHKRGKLPANTLKKLIDIKDTDGTPGFASIR